MFAFSSPLSSVTIFSSKMFILIVLIEKIYTSFLYQNKLVFSLTQTERV